MHVTNDEFKHESYQDTNTITDDIKSLKEGLEKGVIVLGNANQQIELEPKGLIKTEIKAKKKGDSSRLTLRISWKEEKKSGKKGAGPLFIQSNEKQQTTNKS